MQINKITNSLNFESNRSEPRRVVSSNHFYESSEASCKPCQKSSCQGCCLKDFFTQLKNFITYPFVKLYELFFGSSSKKEGKDIEGTEENKTKSKERSASPEVSDDESNASGPEEESEQPEEYNETFFFNLGARGTLLSTSGVNQTETLKIMKIARENATMRASFASGLAYCMGRSGGLLPSTHTAYKDSYERGQLDFNLDYFYSLGRDNTPIDEVIGRTEEDQINLQNLAKDERMIKAYNLGLAFYLGKNGLELRAEFVREEAYIAEYEKGELSNDAN